MIHLFQLLKAFSRFGSSNPCMSSHSHFWPLSAPIICSPKTLAFFPVLIAPDASPCFVSLHSTHPSNFSSNITT